jgi:hypothetical protein
MVTNNKIIFSPFSFLIFIVTVTIKATSPIAIIIDTVALILLTNHNAI